MKLRLAILLFIIVAAVTATASERLMSWLSLAGLTDGPSAITEASTRDETGRSTISYRLDPDRWTTFTFPQSVDALRILSHADVAPHGSTSVGDTFRYGIEIEVLNDAGEVLRSLTRFFRTELVIYTDARDGAQVTARRYSDDPGLPLAVDRLVLQFGDLSDASHVRMRAYSMDAGLTGLNVRVYRPRPFTRKNTSALWERLSLSEKKALSLGYVHEPDDLSDPERKAILSNRWIPFGPLGVEGRDYDSRKLEIYDAPGVRVSGRDLSGAAGVFVEPGRQIGMRLPEGVADLHFYTVPVELSGEDDGAGDRWPAGVTLSVRAKQTGSADVIEKAVALDGQGTAELSDIDASIVTVGADHPILVRAVARNRDGSLRDLTEAIPRVRYQVAQRDAPLSFGVVHFGDSPAPFRLDLRCLCKTSDQAKVSLSLFDDAGRVIGDESVALVANVSTYDRLAADPRQAVSEAESHYLSLSPNVARLEVWSDQPLLVAGFARPIAVPRRYAIPEEYYAAEGDAADNRTWFPVNAELPAGGTVQEQFVERPTRISEDDDAILPELLSWEQFIPEGDWIAREALVARSSAQITTSAFDQFYVRLPLTGTTDITLTSEVSGSPLQPKLLLLGEGARKGEVRIDVDGATVARGVMTVPARIELPVLSPGPHEVSVTAPEGVHPFMSNIAGDAEGYLGRRPLRLAPGTIKFRVPKLSEGREVLSLSLFPAAKLQGRGTLHASLEAPRPENRLLSDWTIERRLFDIRFNDIPEGGILLPSGAPLGAQRTMYFVLGADLPIGTYTLSVSSEMKGEVLFLMSRSRLPEGRRLSVTFEKVQG